MQFVRKTRLGERVDIILPRAIQLAPEPRPRTLLQRRRTRGMAPSRKTGKMVGWSEPLERDYLLHLEFDPAVCIYAYRPAAGEVVIDLPGKADKFIPSYQVTYKSGETVFAVTCGPEQVAHHDHPFLCEIIHARYQAIGCRLAVITAATIYRSPRFDNLQRLDSCRSVAFPHTWRTEAARVISANGTCHLAELVGAFGGGQRVERQVVAMIAAGLIETDLDVPIGASVLSIPAESHRV